MGQQVLPWKLRLGNRSVGRNPGSHLVIRERFLNWSDKRGQADMDFSSLCKRGTKEIKKKSIFRIKSSYTNVDCKMWVKTIGYEIFRRKKREKKSYTGYSPRFTRELNGFLYTVFHFDCWSNSYKTKKYIGIWLNKSCFRYFVFFLQWNFIMHRDTNDILNLGILSCHYF